MSVSNIGSSGFAQTFMPLPIAPFAQAQTQGLNNSTPSESNTISTRAVRIGLPLSDQQPVAKHVITKPSHTKLWLLFFGSSIVLVAAIALALFYRKGPARKNKAKLSTDHTARRLGDQVAEQASGNLKENNRILSNNITLKSPATQSLKNPLADHIDKVLNEIKNDEIKDEDKDKMFDYCKNEIKASTDTDELLDIYQSLYLCTGKNPPQEITDLFIARGNDFKIASNFLPGYDNDLEKFRTMSIREQENTIKSFFEDRRTIEDPAIGTLWYKRYYATVVKPEVHSSAKKYALNVGIHID